MFEFKLSFNSAALTLVTIILVSGCAKSELTELIQKYGFQRISPPRNSLSPGSVITIKDISKEEKIVKVACWPDQAYPDLPKPEISKTVTVDLKSRVEKEFSLEASYLNVLEGTAESSHIKSVALSLSNSAVWEVSLADLASAEKSRLTACSVVLKELAQKKIPVFVITSVLSADVQYKLYVDNSSSLSLDAKQKLLKSASAKLGGTIASIDDLTLSGIQLHWGMYLDSADSLEASSVLNSDMPKVMALPEEKRKKLLRTGAAILVEERSLADDYLPVNEK
jgi:hypothetical protein